MASPPSNPSFPNSLMRIAYPFDEEGDLVPTDPISVPAVVFGSIPTIAIDVPPVQIARLLNNLHGQGFRFYHDFRQHGGEGRFHYQSILLGLSSRRSIFANIEAFANTLFSPEVGIYQESGTPLLLEIITGLNSMPYIYLTSRSSGDMSPATSASLLAARRLLLEWLRYSTSGWYSALQSPEFTSPDSMGRGRVASSFLPHSGQDLPLLYNQASDLESGVGFFSPYNRSPYFRSEEDFFYRYNSSRNLRSGQGFLSPYNISRNLRTGGGLFPTRFHPTSEGASSQPNSMDIENGSGGNGGEQQPQNPSMMTETFMVVTAEVGLALLTVMSGNKSTLSTNAKILLYSAGICNVGGFVCCLGATLKLGRTPGAQFATKTMAAIAKVATSYGFLAVMGTLLPDKLMLWVTIPGAVVELLPLSYAFIKN